MFPYSEAFSVSFDITRVVLQKEIPRGQSAPAESRDPGSESQREELRISQALDSSLKCNLVPILFLLYPFHAHPFHPHPRVSSSSPSNLISHAYHYTYCSCHPDCFSANFQRCVTETFQFHFRSSGILDNPSVLATLSPLGFTQHFPSNISLWRYCI